jgi:hypothetical protein
MSACSGRFGGALVKASSAKSSTFPGICASGLARPAASEGVNSGFSRGVPWRAPWRPCAAVEHGAPHPRAACSPQARSGAVAVRLSRPDVALARCATRHSCSRQMAKMAQSERAFVLSLRRSVGATSRRAAPRRSVDIGAFTPLGYEIKEGCVGRSVPTRSGSTQSRVSSVLQPGVVQRSCNIQNGTRRAAYRPRTHRESVH